MVVDNCEHLLDAVANLVETLERACRRVVVLSTSREGLATDGERILALPSLASPEASAGLETIATSDSVALFVDRARGVDAEFELCAENAQAVAQVCKRLDGVPLAIELAAARVTTMTPTELAQGLDHRFEMLAGGRRRAVERHQTLRAAIDWSFELCSDAERRLLMRMSVFSGGATRDAIEAVCGVEPIAAEQTFALLSSLVAKSLVIAQRDRPRTRYRLLETIREYGEEQLGEARETQALRSAHAEYYCALAHAITEELLGPDQIDAARRFELERDNLLAAVHHAIDIGDADMALRLMRSTPSPTYQLGTPAFLPDRAILEIPGASDHPLYAYGLAVTAIHCALRGELQEVESACAEALVTARRASDEPDPFVMMLVCNARGSESMALGSMADSARYWEESIEIARTRGMSKYLPGMLGTAALMHEMAGNTAAAIPLATEGVKLARQVGRPTIIVMNLAVLAAALVDQDPRRSKELLDESLRLRLSLGFEGYADTSQLTFTAARLGDWNLVCRVAPISIRTLHWTAQRPSLAGILNVVARALAPTAAEASGVLQGVARRLVATGRPPTIGAEQSGTRVGSMPRQVSGPVSFVTKIRNETTSLLIASLGEELLRDLRARGEAMDEDAAVEFALDAIERTTPEAEAPGP
jgi:predicted ATPase